MCSGGWRLALHTLSHPIVLAISISNITLEQIISDFIVHNKSMGAGAQMAQKGKVLNAQTSLGSLGSTWINYKNQLQKACIYKHACARTHMQVHTHAHAHACAYTEKGKGEIDRQTGSNFLKSISALFNFVCRYTFTSCWVYHDVLILNLFVLIDTRSCCWPGHSQQYTSDSSRHKWIECPEQPFQMTFEASMTCDKGIDLILKYFFHLIVFLQTASLTNLYDFHQFSEPVLVLCIMFLSQLET